MTRFRKLFGPAFIIASICCVSAWNVPAKAQVVLEMSMVTCGQYMGQGRERQDLIAAWMSGYFNAAKNPERAQSGQVRSQQKGDRTLLQDSQARDADERNSKECVLRQRARKNARRLMQARQHFDVIREAT
jgi:HdeA/HdeB family